MIVVVVLVVVVEVAVQEDGVWRCGGGELVLLWSGCVVMVGRRWWPDWSRR